MRSLELGCLDLGSNLSLNICMTFASNFNKCLSFLICEMGMKQWNDGYGIWRWHRRHLHNWYLFLLLKSLATDWKTSTFATFPMVLVNFSLKKNKANMQRTLPSTPCTCNSRQLFLFSQTYYILNKRQGNSAYCSPWDCTELDTTTERLSNIASLRRKDWPVRFVSGLRKCINILSF